MIPWITAETLAPEVLSVASLGDAPRAFAGWQRALQRQLTKMPALYDKLSTARVTEAVLAVRDSAAPLDLDVGTRSGPHLLRARPVLGPAGDVHAVRLWMGPASAAAESGEPGAAVGAIWDLDSQTLAVPGGLTQLTGLSAEEYVPRMSIAELFQRITGFDRHGEVLDLLYAHGQSGPMQFDATVADSVGRRGQWRFTLRGRDDNRSRGAWLLIEDVTSAQVESRWPTLEYVGLREAHRRAGTCLAVVQLERTSISHWLTDPAPWIRWDYLFRPGDVFHPEDRDRLTELAERVQTGFTAGAVVRTLDYCGSYTPTSLLLYPYPGFSHRPLAIVEFVRVDDAAQFPGTDGGGDIDLQPSHPLGYDEQLRYRRAGRSRVHALSH
ncbi:GAF domain-containing protein [Nocardia tengchongensis]|uniref:GAF domain-containing protein n=1 Tax=Nocardia tengchongensis TaxID=2055889 RepID=UPI0036812F49